jgi:predicted kinase
MNSRVRKLAEQARQLSPEEQAELLDLLLVMSTEKTPEWEQAWAEEIERRVDRLNRGEAVLYDAEEVLAELRAKCG